MAEHQSGLKSQKTPPISPSWVSYGGLFWILWNVYGVMTVTHFIQYFARNWPWYSLRGLHIRITWFSLYGIRIPLFSLYGIHMPLLPYMVIQPIVLGMALLWTLHCHKDRYCGVTMIWPLLFHGIRADLSETPNNALTTRMHGDYRPSIDRFFVGFNAICYPFLRNNPIYIEGRNCNFRTVPVLFNKCSGLRPSDTLLSWWVGWRRHARVRKPFVGKSLDL